ncbi:unnamed protein product [Closterium sp. Naga37s-1]|nr:unnamed protein product [Closterium sp. Naga37s-1]
MSTVLTTGLKPEAIGMFTKTNVPLFMYENGREYPGCGFELAFSVNFTFALPPKAKAASNGFAFVVSSSNTVGTNDTSIAAVISPFPLANKKPYTAWVDYMPGDPGTIQVFLATTAVKPAKPLLESRLSLCAVLQPGPPEGRPRKPWAFYFGFVASTTVKPFMTQAILSSYLRTGWCRPPFCPAHRAEAHHGVLSMSSLPYAFPSLPFPSDACWALAVVASIEAAYGIASNLEALKLSVDSLFTSMGLTTQAAKCTLGGSLTDAFEKLLALPKGAITLEGNPGFERAAFKGYAGLMMAVQRQPMVVHIEASVASFGTYDGVSAVCLFSFTYNVLGKA